MYPPSQVLRLLIDLRRRAMSRPLFIFLSWGLGLLFLFYLSHGNFLAPFKFSYNTARELLESEAELARVKKMTKEYHAAAKYATTPEGKEFARKMMFNQPNPDESVMKITPAPSDIKTLSPGGQLHQWAEAEKVQLIEYFRYNFKVIYRWICDPPKQSAKT